MRRKRALQIRNSSVQTLEFTVQTVTIQAVTVNRYTRRHRSGSEIWSERIKAQQELVRV